MHPNARDRRALSCCVRAGRRLEPDPEVETTASKVGRRAAAVSEVWRTRPRRAARADARRVAPPGLRPKARRRMVLPGSGAPALPLLSANRARSRRSPPCAREGINANAMPTSQDDRSIAKAMQGTRKRTTPGRKQKADPGSAELLKRRSDAREGWSRSRRSPREPAKTRRRRGSTRADSASASRESISATRGPARERGGRQAAAHSGPIRPAPASTRAPARRRAR